MKSAYELAMERLTKEDPDAGTPLSPEQKQTLADIDQKYKAKIAEREVFLSDKLIKARQEGNSQDIEQLERQLRDERTRLQDELEAAKEKVRKG